MSMVELISLAGIGLVGLGLIGTWIKNGRGQARRDQELVDNQKNILKRLDDEETGLSAMNKKVADFKVHCAQVSTGIAGRMTAAERDIKELKQKSKKG